MLYLLHDERVEYRFGQIPYTTSQKFWNTPMFSVFIEAAINSLVRHITLNDAKVSSNVSKVGGKKQK